MSGRIIIIAVLASLPTLVSAQAVTKYQCTYGELERRVEILTEPGVSVPCEVHYFKDTEAPGESQVLWSASNDASYCETKTTEFVAKLEGWGWDCGGADAPAPAEEEAEDMADDTEALAPADDDAGIE